MITALARRFIKNYENVKDPAVRQSYGVLCGAVGIGFNLLLFLGKFSAGLLSGSIAVTADAFNNLSDAGSSVITLLGFQLAGKKPDSGHPFGHGRIEYISGLVVSLAILLMGVELGRTSFLKILNPEPVDFSLLAVGILVASICVKLYMASYNSAVGKKIDSAAMRATATDSLSDTMATSGVLLSMLLVRFANLNVDGWFGLVVAALICFAGYKAAKETISPLMGQPPTPEFVDSIRNYVMSHDKVLGYHDLIVHDYGPGRRMVSLHVEVPVSMGFMAAHDMIDNIEIGLGHRLGCDVTIHMDPIDTDDRK
ncbi:MAG TPA: cation diffusion facilitator family transporter, partial [Oscillospiraceae bacterium]|nr:cation diffusion facilitator family transporter [Oscillospiraceae bacterium]